MPGWCVPLRAVLGILEHHLLVAHYHFNAQLPVLTRIHLVLGFRDGIWLAYHLG